MPALFDTMRRFRLTTRMSDRVITAVELVAFTALVGAIARAAGKLRATPFTIDGEAVIAEPDGVAAFDELHGQRRLGEAFLWAFDLLELNGEDPRGRREADSANAGYRGDDRAGDRPSRATAPRP
jgi:hypothetical protein